MLCGRVLGHCSLTVRWFGDELQRFQWTSKTGGPWPLQFGPQIELAPSFSERAESREKEALAPPRLCCFLILPQTSLQSVSALYHARQRLLICCCCRELIVKSGTSFSLWWMYLSITKKTDSLWWKNLTGSTHAGFSHKLPRDSKIKN